MAAHRLPDGSVLLFCLSLLFASGWAERLQAVGCLQNKIAGQGSDPVCTFSRGGLVVLCNQHPYYEAADACAAQGYRLAQLTESNLMWAQSVLPNCVAEGGVWIGSLNGLSADPCLAFFGDISASSAQFSCLERQMQVMCEVIPVTTDTVSTTATVTVSEGTATVCTTTTDYRQHHRRQSEGLFIEKRCTPEGGCNDCFADSPGTVCNCCSDACSVTVAGLHLVFADYAPYSEAAAICCKHKWRLADFTAGMSSLVHKYLVPACRNATVPEMATWIRSYEGVDGFQCLQLQLDRDGNQEIVFGHDDQFCNGEDNVRDKYVLCQEDPALVTGSGPVVGSVTTTTTFSNTTVYETVPSTTTTVTRTVHCRNEFKRPSWIVEEAEEA